MTGPDVGITNWMAAHRTGWADWPARAGLSAGTNMWVLALVLGVAVVLVVVRRSWVPALTVAGAVVLAAVVSTILKILIGRPRPSVELALVHIGGYSMPSTDGAVTAAAAFALFLAIGLPSGSRRRLFGFLLAAIVALIGLGMVYLGAHWATDVLAGWAVGITAAWLTHRVVLRLPLEHRRRSGVADSSASTVPQA